MLKTNGNALHKIVLPSHGDLFVDCGNCGSREFAVIATPIADYAKVIELVCTRCKKVFKLDDQARLGGKAVDHRIKKILEGGQNGRT